MYAVLYLFLLSDKKDTFIHSHIKTRPNAFHMYRYVPPRATIPASWLTNSLACRCSLPTQGRDDDSRVRKAVPAGGGASLAHQMRMVRHRGGGRLRRGGDGWWRQQPQWRSQQRSRQLLLPCLSVPDSASRACSSAPSCQMSVRSGGVRKCGKANERIHDSCIRTQDRPSGCTSDSLRSFQNDQECAWRSRTTCCPIQPENP